MLAVHPKPCLRQTRFYSAEKYKKTIREYTNGYVSLCSLRQHYLDQINGQENKFPISARLHPAPAFRMKLV